MAEKRVKQSEAGTVRRLPLHVYICYLLVAVLLIGSVSLSRYVAEGEGSDAARVALLAGGEATADFTVDAAGSYPGGTWMVPVTVSNYEGDKVSEVRMAYTVSLENATGNLPLEYSLYNDREGTDEAEEGWITEAGRKEDKTFWLGVQWPEEKNQMSYAYEIDILQLRVSAEQVD